MKIFILFFIAIYSFSTNNIIAKQAKEKNIINESETFKDRSNAKTLETWEKIYENTAILFGYSILGALMTGTVGHFIGSAIWCFDECGLKDGDGVDIWSYAFAYSFGGWFFLGLLDLVLDSVGINIHEEGKEEKNTLSKGTVMIIGAVVTLGLGILGHYVGFSKKKQMNEQTMSMSMSFPF